jgi:acyl carrier protein
MNKKDLFSKIANALEINDEVTIDSSNETILQWDSLGHISVLSMLDDETDGASSELVDLTQATSVKKIVEILTENDLLEK